MENNRKARAPLWGRALVRAASWIAPSRARADWRRRWEANLWNWQVLFERGEITGRDSAQFARYCRRAVAEAFWLRFSRESLRRLVRGPGFVWMAAAAALLAVAAATRGFSGARALFQPLPFQDPGSLVSVRYNGAANEPFGAPPRLIPLWRAKSSLLSDLAGFDQARGSPRARVTANFFSLMGVRPALGRTFIPGDANAAVLSGGAWRSMFGRDPSVIGRTVGLDGRQYTIVGVLPDAFWALSPSIDVWTPLTLDPQPPADIPFLIGAVGRLKPGASEDQVGVELFDIARRAGQFLPRPPQVASFGAVPSRPYKPYLFGLLFALAAGAVGAAKGLSLPAGRGWRYWSFLTLKTLFLVAIPALLWVQVSGALVASAHVGVVRGLVVVMATLAFVFVCAFAVWWSFADQRGRCPVCLQLLAMPVSLGSWSSVLDPATTELLCDSGHGSLCQPDAVEGPDRWTTLDPSWRELFKGKK